MDELEELNHSIELAKYDNAARYLAKPGIQMSPAEIANINFRGSLLDSMSNTNVLLQRLMKKGSVDV